MSIFSHLFNRKEQYNTNHSLKNENNSPETESVDEKLKSQERSQDIEEQEEIYEVLEREIHPAKIICPDCGGITLEGLEFCDKCGGELQ